MEMVKISKYLSYVLRHKPEALHLSMDSDGWVSIQELIDNSKKYRDIDLDEEIIREVVASNDKQRFDISPDGKSIRANQGHSIAVDLDLSTQVPPVL